MDSYVIYKAEYICIKNGHDPLKEVFVLFFF